MAKSNGFLNLGRAMEDIGTDDRRTFDALVLRILAPQSNADERELVAFADRHGVHQGDSRTRGENARQVNQ